MFWNKDDTDKDDTEFKPYITVQGVTQIPAGKETRLINIGFQCQEQEIYAGPRTIVLYTSWDGIAKTKTFDGKWTLEQMKKWTVEKETK